MKNLKITNVKLFRYPDCLLVVWKTLEKTMDHLIMITLPDKRLTLQFNIQNKDHLLNLFMCHNLQAGVLICPYSWLNHLVRGPAGIISITLPPWEPRKVDISRNPYHKSSGFQASFPISFLLVVKGAHGLPHIRENHYSTPTSPLVHLSIRSCVLDEGQITIRTSER